MERNDVVNTAGLGAWTGGPQPSRGRMGTALSAVWGGLTGITPHVLHHIGPLAGAAILAGTGGRVLFALIALAGSLPFLYRLRRRFQTWAAPAVALGAMAALFALSSFVIGPAISGSPATTPASVSDGPTVDEHGH